MAIIGKIIKALNNLGKNHHVILEIFNAFIYNQFKRNMHSLENGGHSND